ncbi:ABC transporter ATP-binding protein [Lactococcus termiticola]|uniref:ABC transporter ATP-binding protein n=1 Tax=Lactococcus termiticola TaxID=2169526 RepID=A0A2R5HFL4_9LACT|nr:ABC transporter ATP-binding protein [Lactococcus termiticola]
MENLALEIKDLKKVYNNGVEALKGINLSVEAGDFYALLGPNGAGKSTTIGIISSLVNKTSGKVSVFGYDSVKQMVKAKQQLGLVPQEFNFNPFETVLQICVNEAGYYGVPRKLAMERAEKYLGMLELWEKRNDRARMLSGGMKRRLMIARALKEFAPNAEFYADETDAVYITGELVPTKLARLEAKLDAGETLSESEIGFHSMLKNGFAESFIPVDHLIKDGDEFDFAAGFKGPYRW